MDKAVKIILSFFCVPQIDGNCNLVKVLLFEHSVVRNSKYAQTLFLVVLTGNLL